MEVLLREVERVGIQMLGVSETHWPSGDDDVCQVNGWTIVASGRGDGVHRQGVALVISRELSDQLVSYERISERTVYVTIRLEGVTVRFVQVYAPDSSYPDEVYQEFLDELQAVLAGTPQGEELVVMGDLNARVGSDKHHIWPEVVGKHGYGQCNGRGDMLLQFCAINNLVIGNTLFKNRDCRKITWRTPDNRIGAQIDYIMVGQSLRTKLMNCRVYNSLDVGSDHSCLCADFRLQKMKSGRRNRGGVVARYQTDKLLTDHQTAEQYRVIVGGRYEALLEEEPGLQTIQLYENFRDIMVETAQECLGTRRRRQVRGMTADLERRCAERRAARLAKLKHPDDIEISGIYRELNRGVKAEIRRMKRTEMEMRVEQLEIDFRRNNSHNLFKSVRELENKKRRPLQGIKDRNGTVLCREEEVRERWMEHFSEHLGTHFPHEEDALHGLMPRENLPEDEPIVEEHEVKIAIDSLKNFKAPGNDGISSELIKAADPIIIKLMTKIFNRIFQDEVTPADWSRLLIIPIFKKGDRMETINHRAISLTSVPCKVFCRVILARMQIKINEFLKESQYGFRAGRGTVDAIFVMRQIMEKARERHLQLHINFVDFKAAFDTIWRDALWKMLAVVGVSEKLVNLIKCMYENTEAAVVVDGKLTEWFNVTEGVRQGCILSPSLFNVFLEFVMEGVQSLNGITWDEHMSFDIRYADDTTLVALVFDRLELSTAELQRACTKWGMKINATKTKVMTSENNILELDGEELDVVNDFRFLGSIVPGSEDDIGQRISLAASAFGRLRGPVWRRRDISMGLKVRLYMSLIRPIALYASETWTLTSASKRRLETFEMRCLRVLMGVTIRDRIRSEHIRNHLGVKESIVETVKIKRLKWFGHVMRRPPESFVNKAYLGDFQHRRPRGRPPKRWRDQISEDTGWSLRDCEQRARDRVDWRSIPGRVRARGPYGLRP